LLKLHLGCGKRYIPGYIHIDLADYPHIDFKQRVDDLSNFADNTVDLIYAFHVLEYFDRFEVKRVLAEWRRVLKPGGILRVAVPDFEALVEVYLKYKDLNLIHGPLYGRWEIPSSTGPTIIYHKTCYDFVSLQRTLSDSGFINIHRYDWRETEHKNYDDYSQAYIPHMDKEHGKLISLNVEATKP
jgi:ubiquinone/menaquinone biosynthesis C-methylase UbiE